ncbi:hypothetical protein N9H49_04750 [Luminiphilus sp.]|nr:hypothetical protein [Luminiphilus sp.]
MLGAYQFFIATTLLPLNPLFPRVVVLATLVALILARVKLRISSYLLLTALLVCFLLLGLVEYRQLLLNALFFALILMLLFGSKVPTEEVVEACFFATACVIVLHYSMFYLGIVSSDEVVVGERARSYFGMKNPNKVGVLAYFGIVSAVLWGAYNKRFWPLLFCYIGFLLHTLVLSDSRAPLFAILFMVLFMLVPERVQSLRTLPILIIVCLGVSFYSSLYYHGTALDLIVSGRLSLNHEYLAQLDYTAWIFGASPGDFTIDNSFILLYFGLSPWLLMIGIARLCFVRTLKFNSRSEVAFVHSIVIYGMFESLLVRVEFPLVVLFYFLIIQGARGQPSVGDMRALHRGNVE